MISSSKMMLSLSQQTKEENLFHKNRLRTLLIELLAILSNKNKTIELVNDFVESKNTGQLN